MRTEVVDVSKARLVTHDEGIRLARTEYERFTELLGSLSDADLNKPTDCDRRDVRAVVSHLISMCDAFTSFRDLQRQQKKGRALAKELGLTNFDGWTEHQSRSHADATVAELLRLYSDRWPNALRRRDRLPVPIRWVRIPSPPYGWFSFAYLLDDILTRDVWMHRVDISRSIGREVVLTPEHDGRVVANIVADLAKRWKRPFSLALEGPAGGRFISGEGGPDVRVDAVECCRILSGRSTGHGLPIDVVPF